MSLFKHLRKDAERVVAIFDIGSGSIGGAFVGITAGESPEILFTVRRDIPFQEKLNFRRFLDAMTKTLEEIAKSLKESGVGLHAEEAYCVLASPWYASQTRLVRFAQETPFTVTKSGLDELVQKEISALRDSKMFDRAKMGEALPEIMETKNLQIKLNGYETKDPLKKKTSELELALYISMVPANIRRTISASIGKFWKPWNVHFSSFSLAAFETLRETFPDDRSFLFADISGEVTDISLVRNGVLFESLSFPSGKNFLIRGLLHKTKTSAMLVNSELDLYAKHESTLEHAKQINDVLGESTKEWQGFFGDALTQLALEFPIPRTIFYTADNNVAEWLGGAIREEGARRFSREEGAFRVISLSDTFLSKHIRTALPDFQDSFLAIEAIFAYKLSSFNLTDNL